MKKADLLDKLSPKDILLELSKGYLTKLITYLLFKCLVDTADRADNLYHMNAFFSSTE